MWSKLFNDNYGKREALLAIVSVFPSGKFVHLTLSPVQFTVGFAILLRLL